MSFLSSIVSLRYSAKIKTVAHPKHFLGILFFTAIAAASMLPGPAWATMRFIEAQYGGPVLDDATSVAASPDGHHLYATGYRNGVIAIFDRDSSTGALALTGTQRDGVDGVDGLDGAMDVAISPDGQSLYAVGYWDNGVAVFRRDSSSGQLTYIEVQKDGVGGVDGIEGAEAIAVSPDSRHVYVAGSFEDSVVVFSRDLTSGALTFLEMLNDEIGGVEGIYGASSISFSSDGSHLYVTGYYGDSLAVFSRNTITGELTFIEAHFDGIDGVDGLGGAYNTAISSDGNHLYVAGEFDDAVALFARDPITGRLTFVQAIFDQTGGITGLAGAHDIAISSDGSHLYVSGWFDDSLVTFERDSATGGLSFLQVLYDDTDGVDGLYGARSVVISSDDAHLYVSGEYDNGVGVFSLDNTSGQLDFAQIRQDRYDGADGLYGAIDVTVSPDGRHVYAAGYDDDSVAVFARNSATGQLTFIEALRDNLNGIDGLNAAHAVLISPDGAHLYAAGYYDDAVAVFSRDATTGRLSFITAYKDGVGGVDGLNGPQSLAVSPDGDHLYVTGYLEDAIAVFERNSTSGALTFVEVIRDNTNGVDGLDAVRAIMLTSDGNHLYAGGRTDSAVALFSRNSDTGMLAFEEMIRDGINGVDGIYGLRAIAISADDHYLYGVGHYDDAVAVFSRNSVSGSLTFVENYEDGVDGINGLNGASDAVVSPDGDYLYASGHYDNAIVAFVRDSNTGRLVFEEMQQDGIGGVDGLGAASALAVSPSGDHLYVASPYDSSIAVFSLRAEGDTNTAGDDGSGGGCFLNTLN